jgi:hypothetical protein
LPVVDGGANDVSKLSTAVDGSRLAIHGNLEFAGTVLAADPVSVRVSHFKDVRSLGNVRSLGHSAALGAEAARRLASDQSTSAVPESPVRFRGKVIILDFDHNAVLETAPPLVLELPVDWPALTSITTQSWRQRHAWCWSYRSTGLP